MAVEATVGSIHLFALPGQARSHRRVLLSIQGRDLRLPANLQLRYQNEAKPRHGHGEETGEEK